MIRRDEGNEAPKSVIKEDGDCVTQLVTVDIPAVPDSDKEEVISNVETFLTNALQNQALSVGRNRDYDKIILEGRFYRWYGWLNSKDGGQIPLVTSLLHNFFGKKVPTDELVFSKGTNTQGWKGMFNTFSGTAKNGNLHLDLSDPDEAGANTNNITVVNLWVYLDPAYIREHLGTSVYRKVLNHYLTDKAEDLVKDLTLGYRKSATVELGIKLRFHMDSVITKKDGTLEAQFQVVEEATTKTRVKDVFLKNHFKDCDAIMLKELDTLFALIPVGFDTSTTKGKAAKSLKEIVGKVLDLGKSERYKKGVKVSDYLHGADSLARWYFYVMQQCQATSADTAAVCEDRVGDFANHTLGRPTLPELL